MRVVIYARYSGDLQSERSIDDQVRLCRDYAGRHGHEVVGIYADYALSGAQLRNRPEANRLIADARGGTFDAVLTEALDRMSRDQEDIARIFKQFQFSGIKLLTTVEGEVGELHIGLKGTMNALFLKDLAAKVRRGQKGRAADGFCAGGLSYGYRVKREFDARGELVRGLREIDPDQAAVVRRIFTEYAAGRPARSIAADLNRDLIPSPSGREWGASTLNGNKARASGILHNGSYAGKVIYNRTTFVTDPDTGKRVSRSVPIDEWVTASAEHLRIIPDALWEAAQARKASYAHLSSLQQRRPKHLFSGLIRCGACGAAYTVKNRSRLGCSAHRERGTCGNGHTITVEQVECRALAGIKQRLLNPEAIVVFVREYHAERKRLSQASAARRGDLDRRHKALTAQISNLIDAIAEGLASPAMKDRLRASETEKAAIEAERAQIAAAEIVELHPAAIESYRRTVVELQAALAGDGTAREEAMAIIRGLVTKIEVRPTDQRGKTEILVHGALAELINLATRPPGERVSTVLMVAGEGFEPPTLGL